MLTDAASRAWGTLVVLKELAGERGATHGSAEALHAGRDHHVREVVRYAARHVPHYRELFRREGIEAAEIRSADGLAQIPLLEKVDVQTDPERFRAQSRAGRRAVEFRTTGSTGQPVTVFHDRTSLLRNIAFSERERAVEARLLGRRSGYTVLQIGHAAATERRVQRFYARSTFRPLRPSRHRATVEDPLDDVLATVTQIQPDVIRSYGSYLELLFRRIAARRVRVPLPRVVVYAGDTLSRDGRRLIEDEFGVPVLSQYNAVEAFKIGFLCEERQGFHVHEDLCHVTIVDPDGRSTSPGQTGEVVISNLVNRGSVLLNYRLGDIARSTTVRPRIEAPCRPRGPRG